MFTQGLNIDSVPKQHFDQRLLYFVLRGHRGDVHAGAEHPPFAPRLRIGFGWGCPSSFLVSAVAGNPSPLLGTDYLITFKLLVLLVKTIRK